MLCVCLYLIVFVFCNCFCNVLKKKKKKILHLMVSEILPEARLPIQLPAQPDTMGENNNRTAFKDCGVSF